MVHCEKTMFLLFAGIAITPLVIIFYFWFQTDIGYTLVFIGIIGFGSLGSMYYRITHHKKPYWQIWKTK